MTSYCMLMEARGGADNRGTMIQVGRSRVWFLMVSFGFFIGLILPAEIWPWGWLSPQYKWQPGLYPWG